MNKDVLTHSRVFTSNMEDHDRSHNYRNDMHETCCFTIASQPPMPSKDSTKRYSECTHKAGRLMSLRSPHFDYNMKAQSLVTSRRADKRQVPLFHKNNQRSQIGSPSRVSERGEPENNVCLSWLLVVFVLLLSEKKRETRKSSERLL